MKKLSYICLAALAFVSVLSCDDDSMEMPPEVIPAPDMMVYGLTDNNQLVAFNSKNSASFSSTKTIMGVPSGEKLLSIDFRPATGELYAVSNASKFYIINTSTGNTRPVSTTSFTPAISGTIASIDFNPTVDRIRLVTNTGQNLRLHPETGALAATDTGIATSSSITGIAYTNSVSGASSTILYDLDATSGKLFKQDPPNNGTLVEVGSLGITFTGQAAFDINPDNSVALMAATTGSQNSLYKVDLSNGKATNIGNLSQKILDLAIPTNPVAYAVNDANALQIFNPENPQPVTKTITGLQTGENILGIDFRPLNGQLYALGSSSRIYTINLGTGAATVVGTQLPTLLSGTEFGFDFNPVVDKIRVVSNTGQNLRLDPVTGGITGTDTNLSPTPVAVSAAAYTNNFAGTTATELFVIDHNTDKLYLQNPPNGGILVERGSLGINISQANGFDIGSTSQKAYLMATVGTETKLYTVNTTTGAAASLGTYPNLVKGFTVGLGF
ncbi:hypothetical protein IX39_18650 [Chryseobacterium formosense]|uniref:DUF4394 domain-containing protein n=1 Tax=Chryseobacterium formosense TaxID=236814 RepID=A0A085Z016_9FLAO|nr:MULTISPECIES: DUF4394 domain-containing protein [Chryseobacterium]KFE97779.1 hypothetical protein IX39_18650 [Chryseobacterium formosense]OCK51880.1 hypothetical protein BA768_15340 [Chryseobacterium sp. CBo1]SFT83641.1 protein of unknown function [Chryseobacterium formosense]